MGVLVSSSSIIIMSLEHTNTPPFFPQSQQYHLNNPYWKTFDPYVIPLLAAPMDLRRLEELDTTVTSAGAHYHEDAVKAETSVGDMYQGTDA
jgi:hypothetical protein